MDEEEQLTWFPIGPEYLLSAQLPDCFWSKPSPELGKEGKEEGELIFWQSSKMESVYLCSVLALVHHALAVTWL